MRLYHSFFTNIRKFLRRLMVGAFVVLFPLFRRFSKKKWIFNIDCHISVIADLKKGFESKDKVKLVSWSLSSHNFVFRKFFVEADPVFSLDGEKWRDLSEDRIGAFSAHFSRFLSCFDGFVVTYPTSFVRLFSHLEKPVLVVIATRYEHPYSRDADNWKSLDRELLKLHAMGLLVLVANNRGDSEYATHFLKIEIPVVPSVCDYIPKLKRLQPLVKVVYAPSKALEKKVAEVLGINWVSAREYLGEKYSWAKLSHVSAVFYVPQNSSTMTLFELATLGIPTIVPDASLIRSLSDLSAGAMAQLSFRRPTEALARQEEIGFPGADQSTDAFKNWWYSRADFLNDELMPNVQLVTTFDDAKRCVPQAGIGRVTQENLDNRNEILRRGREELIDRFVKLL